MEELIEEYRPEIVKAQHYFSVVFDEIFASVNNATLHGRPYIIICDGFPTHVYGFSSEEEAKAFDATELRSLIRGDRQVTILWDAPDELTLMKEINDDSRVKGGVYALSQHALYGPIEDLPLCERMYHDPNKGELFCGKPQNEYNDGCRGGCVLQGYDQDFDEDLDFVCPVQKFWKERFEKKQKEKNEKKEVA